MASVTNIRFEELLSVFKSGFDSMYKFNFSLDNPSFWLSMLVLYLVLRRFLRVKNAVTFLLLTACILLLATKFEARTAQAMSAAGEKLDPWMVRLFSLTLVGIAFMFFMFLK